MEKLLLLLIALLFTPPQLDLLAQEKFRIEAIDFIQEQDVGRLEFTFNRNGVQANKFNVTEDKQLILDFIQTTASSEVARAFDTSEFSGAVVFISPYPKPGSVEDYRVAIQLRDNVRTKMEASEKKVIIYFENRFGAFDSVKDNLKISKIDNKEKTIKLVAPKSNAVEDILENITLSGDKKYVGKKITLNVRDVPISEVLNMIADTSGFNMILDKEVLASPNITLNLTNIPWDQILDTILNLSKLVAKKNGNILMVTTLAKATREREQEIQASDLVKRQEPLVTKIFPISFAKLSEISPIIQDYLTPTRGKLSRDERTNWLIVKDTVETIERIKKIIDVLDTQTPQILIESKIVEVSEDHRKELGLKNGISFGYDPIGAVGVNTAGVGATTVGDGEGYVGPGFSFASAPVEGLAAIGLNITRWSRLINLDMQLSMMEFESKIKIVASPKVITENKKAATITSTETIRFPQTVTDSAGNTTESFQDLSATLSLVVTPQVTNEGSIAMEIKVDKTDLGNQVGTAPPPTSTRSVQTNVLVDNGSTVVIGGVYRETAQESHSGIPLLKDIPLLGWLFRTHHNPRKFKTEMVIFLTPRIVNQEEAGLVDNAVPVT